MDDEHPWDNYNAPSEYELIEAARYGPVAFDPQLESRIRLEEAKARKYEAKLAAVRAEIELKKLRVEERRLRAKIEELRLVAQKSKEATEAAKDERHAVQLEIDRRTRECIQLIQAHDAKWAEDLDVHQREGELRRFCQDEQSLHCPRCRQSPTKRFCGTRFCTCCDWVDDGREPMEAPY